MEGQDLKHGRMSRKQFLTGAAGASLGILGLGALASCSSEEISGNASAAGSGGSSVDEKTTDLVIVGTGLGGIVAGLRAQQAGVNSIIVDKRAESVTGGNTAISGGYFSLPITDDAEGVEAFFEDYMTKSKNRADEELTRVLAERVWEGFNWLVEQGAEFNEPTVNEPYRVLYTIAKPASYQNMPQMLTTLREKYLANGGEILYETKMQKLVVDESTGRVVGIKVRDLKEEKVYNIVGKSVILATGGFAGNKEMLENYCDPNADEMMLRGLKQCTGDGLIAAQEVGASLVQMGGQLSLHVAAVSPSNVAHGNPGSALTSCIGINSEGKRFVDESMGYVAHGKAVALQPGLVDALVFDDSVLSENESVQSSVDLFNRIDIPLVEAQTLDELAEKIEVPVDALKATIEEWNAHVDEETHTASGMEVNKAALAYKVQTPPYHAFYPLKPGITLTFGGLSINTKAEVLEADGIPIPGLYAAGENTGGFFIDDYFGGGSLIRTLVYALIAAENAIASLPA